MRLAERQTMSRSTSKQVASAISRVPFRRPVVVLRPHLTDDDRPGAIIARVAACQRFLRRTQDVSATGSAYPGGTTALIHDREIITLRLVRLLQGR
jgi:hypothetical protein